MNGIDYTNDPRAVLIHFNPNHDKLGRFAKSPSGGVSSNSVDKAGSTRYNKGKEIDKDKLKKYAKIGAGVVAASLVIAGGVYLAKSGKLDDFVKSGKDITDQTLKGFGSVPFDNVQDTGSIKRLSKPDSITDAIRNTNPKRGDPAYDGNCTSCAVAAFMRTRGFNVRAGKVRNKNQLLSSMTLRCFDYDIDTNTLSGDAFKFGSTPEQTSRKLIEKFGNNASGVIGFHMKTRGDRSIGHAFNFTIENGVVKFFDTQEPKLNIDDKFIRKVYWPKMIANLPFEAIRLDNAEPIFDFLELELET
ncbi:MAG: hypothetical protein J6U54_09840 [Clostridiales bacterium]|nr:hypothetical protein [Clostridiales bacterium]